MSLPRGQFLISLKNINDYDTPIIHVNTIVYLDSTKSFYVPGNKLNFKMKIPMKLVYQYMAIFFNFLPTSNHLRPLEVDNCDSNSRLVVDEMTMANSGLKGLKYIHDLYSVACILFDNV